MARRLALVRRGGRVARAARAHVQRTFLSLHPAGTERPPGPGRGTAAPAVARLLAGRERERADRHGQGDDAVRPNRTPSRGSSRKFGDIAGTLGGGMNIIVVLWLLICAGGLWFAHAYDLRWPTRTFVIGCLVLWVVVQDVPFWGGLATDVNTMIPLALLGWCASPALASATPLAAPPARRDAFEFRSGTGILRRGDGPVRRSCRWAGPASRPRRAPCTWPRTVRRPR